MKKLLLALVLWWLPGALPADQPDLFLLKRYDPEKSVVGWVMSEKLDGVRGFWDGRRLRSRGGKIIRAPAWFVADYPPFAIDGELWTRRGDFENITSIVRRQTPDARWRQVRHHIFEAPRQKGGLRDRLAVLRAYLEKNPRAPITIIPQIPITSRRQVQSFLHEVVQKGGEGVVVRNPDTPYQTGRLDTAMKIKTYRDAECVVQKILPGKGKYKNKMGSLLCRMDDRRLIKIGTGFKDAERENPPAIGAVVTFKYYGLSRKGNPRFPVYLRPRPAE